MKIPGHGYQIVAVTGAENNTNCLFITILLQHSHQPVADYIPLIGAYSQNNSLIPLVMYNNFINQLIHVVYHQSQTRLLSPKD